MNIIVDYGTLATKERFYCVRSNHLIVEKNERNHGVCLC